MGLFATKGPVFVRSICYLQTVAKSTSVEIRGRKTTVALKVLMAVTGLFIVFFLLFHAFETSRCSLVQKSTTIMQTG